MDSSFFDNTDDWLSEEGRDVSVVVSCRARFARNLRGYPFPPRARSSALNKVVDAISQVMETDPFLNSYKKMELENTAQSERLRLRESQVISMEMERGGKNRLVFFRSNPCSSLMINEEDHIRMFIIEPGMNIRHTLEQALELEKKLAQRLPFAYSEKFGYLTACPTNAGTGLRVSAMLHLPGLTLTERVERVTEPITSRGMTVRGAYGEHSEHLGDFYQFSNETTLGVTEEHITERLTEVVAQVIGKEKKAREELFQDSRTKIEDKVYRALSVLGSSRIIDSKEAIALLSVLRLGICAGTLRGLSHGALNRLMFNIQPGHLQSRATEQLSPDSRDIQRASLLRDALGGVISGEN